MNTVWEDWIAYRARNTTMTPQEENEIMEEMGVFEELVEQEKEEPKE